MGLVVAAIANTELKGPHTAGPGPASSSSPGERAAEEIRDSEQEARRAVQKLREALGDAKRAKVLEGALEQIWNRSSVLRPSERAVREDAAAEVCGADTGGAVGSGGRLEEELGRLAAQMRGMDVEALLAALKKSEEEKASADAQRVVLEQQVAACVCVCVCLCVLCVCLCVLCVCCVCCVCVCCVCVCVCVCTHTHTHTHSLSLSLTHTHTLSLSLSLSLSQVAALNTDLAAARERLKREAEDAQSSAASALEAQQAAAGARHTF